MGFAAPKTKNISYKTAKNKNTTMSVDLANNLDIHKLIPVPSSSITRWKWHLESLCSKNRTLVLCKVISYISSAFFGGYLGTFITAINDKQPLSQHIFWGFLISLAVSVGSCFYSTPKNVCLIAEEIKKDLEMITQNGDKNE